jgi:outer membrane immunogenic protein
MSPNPWGIDMISKTTMTGMAFAALASSASAADLSYSKAPPVAYVAPVSLSWTGFYVGANVGGVFRSDATARATGTDTGAGGLGTLLAAGVSPTTVAMRQSGIIGGIQAGYNWQLAPSFVFGLEADVQAVGLSNSFQRNATVAGFVPVQTNISENLSWLGTARARLGFLAAPSFMIYATGGLAVADLGLSASTIAPAAAPAMFSTFSANNGAIGWTAGAGVEYKFSSNWSAKLEYLYYDLGTASARLLYNYGANTSTMTIRMRETGHIARVGINYWFASEAPAVVAAKY